MDVKWLVLRTLPLAGTHPSMPSFYRKRKKKRNRPRVVISLTQLDEGRGGRGYYDTCCPLLSLLPKFSRPLYTVN